MELYSILLVFSGFIPDILLFTQAPVLVWFDGTIIGISTILFVSMVPNRVMCEMVLRWGRAIYPCRYRWFPHIIFIISALGST